MKNEEAKKLIEDNIKLAFYVAHKFDGAMEYDELSSCALLGLVKAGNSFDPDKGIKFSTFAAACMEKEILNMMRKERKRKDDVYVFSGLPETQGLVYMDCIEDEKAQDQLNRAENLCIINLAMKSIPERNRKMVIMWANGMKQEEISREFGLSQSYISRVLKKSILKMKQSIEQ